MASNNNLLNRGGGLSGDQTLATFSGAYSHWNNKATPLSGGYTNKIDDKHPAAVFQSNYSQQYKRTSSQSPWRMISNTAVDIIPNSPTKKATPYHPY